MVSVWAGIGIAVGAFFFMEFMAWFTHKYVMHGFLWSWHKSHHAPYAGVFEKNDLFGLVFSLPAAATMYYGLSHPAQWLWLFYIGCGITGYGIFYVLFHDILVHRRVKHSMRPTHPYLKRLIRAHKVHHKTTTKEGAEAFGFLYAPSKYAADNRRD